MEKIIWVIGNSKEDMVAAQRLINSTGSMRAMCLLSFGAVKKAVPEDQMISSKLTSPALIIMDYEMSIAEDYSTLSFLRRQQSLAGVPLFFMAKERNSEIDEECYAKGATVVLHKPFSSSGIMRIERTAWQYEVTKNYEKMLQKQAGDLQAAKEIVRLNRQLRSRNELLYQIFGRYFSDKVLDVILEHPEGAAIGGDKREVTIMMSDLRGFTSLTESLDSDGVTRLLNFYFGKMAEAINRYHGTIIEFLGDAVLAVFGAPLASDTQVEDAIAAAITMQNSMEEVNVFCKEHGYPTLEMGIGLHQGEVFVGNIGSESMMRYNVVGRAVNECSRIESCSVGGQILISTKSMSNISCEVSTCSDMEIHAKGVHKPIHVCEVRTIEGEYQCSMGDDVFDVLSPCEDWIVFNMYLIEEKHVGSRAITAKLDKFSNKRAVVKLFDDATAVEEYSDVEIFAADQDGKAVFTGVYAKIVSRKGKDLTLHFTHINDSFTEFAQDIV